MPITLRELKPAELPQIFPLVRELNLPVNPAFNRARFNALLKDMEPKGYRCLAAFDGDAMVAVCGFTITTRFWCGRQLDLDNFIVSHAYRGKKLGERMLTWFDRLAVREECKVIVLDSYAQSHHAHRFYFRHGFHIEGYHFYKKL